MWHRQQVTFAGHDHRPQCQYHDRGQQALEALYLHAFAAQDMIGLYRGDHRERRDDQDIGGDQRPPPQRPTS